MGKKPAQKSADDAKKAVKSRTEKVKKEKVVKVKAETKSTGPEACKITGCKREYRAKGYCAPHYRKWRQGEYGVARYKTCNSQDCRKPMVLNRHGLCEDHFQKYYVKGESAPVAQAPAKGTEKANDKTAADKTAA